MTGVRFTLGIAAQEFRLLTRGVIIPIVASLMILYMFIILANADYMREMGAVGIPRNSANLNFLMASGQCLWVLPAWAWLFAQGIARDKTHRLDEITLSAPASLKSLLIGRYLGALAVSALLAMSFMVTIIAAPILAKLGLLPADTIGPTRWLSLGWAALIFILPNAASMGALYVSATARTKDTKGAFAIAAIMALVWMVSMIVLRGNDVNVDLAAAIDPSGYAEAERQVDAWTPREKEASLIAVTPQLILNRLFWLGIAFSIFIYVLLRIDREKLVLDRKQKEKPIKAALPSYSGSQSLDVRLDTKVWNWIKASWLEFGWHLGRLTRGFGFRLAIVMLILAGALGSLVNFVEQPQGPLVAYPAALLPFIAEFFYLVIVFVLVGFYGNLMRSDDRPGFDEWVDAARAPLGTVVVAKMLVGLALVVIMSIFPAISSLIVTSVSAPHSLDLILPFSYFLGVFAPSLLEIAAIVFLSHALIRPAGIAYTVSVFVAFIAIINHELTIIEYPPLQIGIPPHVSLSELTGWLPWLEPVLAMAAFKAMIALLFAALAWIAWRRGTALRISDRLRDGWSRIWGAPGLVAITAIALGGILLGGLNHRFIEHGEFQTAANGLSKDAIWEREQWHAAETFDVVSGKVNATLYPQSRYGEIDWRLELSLGATGVLHATEPHGVRLISAAVAGNTLEITRLNERVLINAPLCANKICELDLRLEADFKDWPVDAPLWFQANGIWLSAERILPKLGHDRDGLVTSPLDRKNYALPETLPLIPAVESLAAIDGVAPAANWRWDIAIEDLSVKDTTAGLSGETTGPLDFAGFWMPQENSAYSNIPEAKLWYAKEREKLAKVLAEDISALSYCVSERLGVEKFGFHSAQVPNHLGEIHLHNNFLWLPEDLVWNLKGEGFGYALMKYEIAQEIAKHVVNRELNVRTNDGVHALVNGLAGLTAINCLEHMGNAEQTLDIYAYHVNDVIEQFSTVFTPIHSVAASTDDWVESYAMLSMVNWYQHNNHIAESDVLNALKTDEQPYIADSLALILGDKTSEMLLGPPLSYDLSVHGDRGSSDISGSYWIWQNGSWLDDDFREDSVQVSNTKKDGAMLVYANYPAIERNVQDNYVQDSQAESKED